VAALGLDLEPDAHLEILFDDRFVVLAGADSKWSRRRKLSLADLIHEPWVLPPFDSIPGRRIAQAFRAAGLELPRPQVITFSLPAHYPLLATGRFVTMVPLSMLRFGKHLPLKVLPVDTPDNPYPIGIITLRNRTLSPLAQRFIDCAREVAKPLAKGHQAGAA
jgi:DNA-binding transcriptional LysR family regulator